MTYMSLCVVMTDWGNLRDEIFSRTGFAPSVALLAESSAGQRNAPRPDDTERHGAARTQVPREFPYMFCVQSFTHRFKKSFVLPLVEDDPAWTLRSEMRFTFQIN